VNRRVRALIRAGGGRMAIDPDLVVVQRRGDVSLLLARSAPRGRVTGCASRKRDRSCCSCFEEELVAGAAGVLACALPNAAREEVERAARVDVLRHVGPREVAGGGRAVGERVRRENRRLGSTRSNT